MKVIIFGATGTVGRLFVEQALDEGYHVTAFARHPQKLEIQHPNLTLTEGNAMDPASVAGAIKGHDAVVITLGSGMSRKSVIRSVGTANIIAGMKRHGVRRLVCQSTLGAHESWGNLNFFWKRIMFGALLRPVFKDHELQEDLVRQSGLDWTLVRPSAFTDGPARGTYREDFGSNDRSLSLKIPRADVAAFLRRQLSDGRYLNRAVGVSY
ncbi:NAD(P)-dependent oxidoreductase [Hoeflea prorocentri]|uniref:SDR family oxidoreductase n=1 Tax=Hoeflea prorocentri TaxID=1922333 RepID=A0A9X3UEN1_9HYPH|nr:SDR family oxidoreductase [Hoeflea prorocentri]MCY6379450.1 SDR family oxidoreductase [Hoeflea prorocentri]MDA5397250.1 SDR family oxidoreductase [Hoeflea prorocentri]